MSRMVARVSKFKRCSFTRNGVCKSWKFIKQRECIMYFQLKWINFFSESTEKQRIILLLYASHHGIPKKSQQKFSMVSTKCWKSQKKSDHIHIHTDASHIRRQSSSKEAENYKRMCVCVWLANLWLKSEWTVWKTRRDRGESTRSTVFPFQTNETELTKTKSIWNLLIYFITMPIWESAAHMRER